MAENARQAKRLKRFEEERSSYEQRCAKGTGAHVLPSDELHFSDDEEESDQASMQSEDDSEVSPDTSRMSDLSNSARTKYNTLAIPTIATQSLRYGVGLRATAAIATAAFVDAGLISEGDHSLVIDHSKVKRAQEKVMKALDNDFDEFCQQGKVECIFFDGRIDLTRMMTAIDGRQFPSQVKEEHYSICAEPGGRYLHHFTPTKAQNNKKPAEVIADCIVEFLNQKGIGRSLKAIGGDSTNVNTGRDGGIMHWVEVKLNRKLNWLVCCLHTNELPLRHLIQQLDGQTLSNNKWSGPIGKMLDSATELDINDKFQRLPSQQGILPLSDEVVNDLSTDQSYGYRITKAIQSGELPKDLALLSIGPVNHARWLTTANRLCRLWISHHGLKGKPLKNLRHIVEFITGVYYPCWFEIKVKHSWIEGPRHVLFQLQLIAQQSKEAVKAVLPTAID